MTSEHDGVQMWVGKPHVPQAIAARPDPRWLSNTLRLKSYYLDGHLSKLRLKMVQMHCLIFQNHLRKVKAKLSCMAWNKLTYTSKPLLKNFGFNVYF